MLEENKEWENEKDENRQEKKTKINRNIWKVKSKLRDEKRKDGWKMQEQKNISNRKYFKFLI